MNSDSSGMKVQFWRFRRTGCNGFGTPGILRRAHLAVHCRFRGLSTLRAGMARCSGNRWVFVESDLLPVRATHRFTRNRRGAFAQSRRHGRRRCKVDSHNVTPSSDQFAYRFVNCSNRAQYSVRSTGIADGCIATMDLRAHRRQGEFGAAIRDSLRAVDCGGLDSARSDGLTAQTRLGSIQPEWSRYRGYCGRSGTRSRCVSSMGL